jgi:acyl-CoA thioester hydrolase
MVRGYAPASISPVSGADFTHVEQVRFRDLDPMGHVNNAVFLTYIEQARVAFLAEVGAATALEDMNMVVARVEIDFRAPVRFGQEVEISVRASRFGTKSFDLDYVLRVDGEIVAEAKSVQVAYDYERREPVPLPAQWREKMSAVAA